MSIKKNINFLIVSIIICSFYAFSSTRDLSKVYLYHSNTINWKTKDSCSIILFQDNNSLRLSARIKYRGGASSKYWKHSFSLELDDNFSLANLPEDDDWILNASYVDKTFMRHKISYDLFNEMNPANKAPQSNYIWLVQNDIDQGLYIAMQKINAAFLGLNESDTMAMLFKEPGVFYEKRIGYIPDSSNYYQQKYPKTSVRNKNYYMEDFKNFIFHSTDSVFISEVSRRVDLNNIVDWHLILLFTNNGDGLRKNYYLYKVDKYSPLRFAIWDYDHSFGREGDYELNMMDRELNCRKVILLKRLMDIKEIGYNEMLEKRWHQLRDTSIFSVENLNNHINAINTTISPFIDENAKIWPMKSKWYSDTNNYQEEVELIKKYAEIRIPQLDERFNYTESKD